MFTGTIEITGTVKTLWLKSTGAVVEITAGFKDLALGESIAVNGACLTVAKILKDGFAADLSRETLDTTTFKVLRAGAMVNLERALKLGDRLGGHLVAGHVDCLGRVEQVTKSSRGGTIEISVDSKNLKYIVNKGSIAVDGISLTMAQKTARGFKAAVIPHTWKNTNLQNIKTGDKVNLELDQMAKYVESIIKGE
ncbi:riboflavin synthase [candidate division TA06 bacterium]|uniref:Riboflavin synthase n=1 Tax=candidate division TA06 bacterium TaxID=2250710 RepID=A0A933IAF3_UNCT6|nr:riboflavin synthase [candidate division TA06 bacterium]